MIHPKRPPDNENGIRQPTRPTIICYRLTLSPYRTSVTKAAMKLFEELKRRRVLKVAGIYIVAMFATLQGAQVLVQSLSLPAWTMTMLTLIGLFAFPLVLALTWVFDVTPEGIRRSPVVAGSRIPLYAGLAIVLLLVSVGAYSMLPDERDPEASVAVLPFVDMSEAKDQEFFGDGITEEILNTLVKVPGLRVPGRTSSFSFKGRNVPITEIAQQLKVAHVLEGSIRTWGDSIRITAQLIDATTDKHMWSEQYDRRSADVFAIQGEIAHAIVEALRLRIKMPMRGAVDARAYESYLKGMYHSRTTNELPQALDAYRAAVRSDSKFADAWAAMALTYALLPEFTDFDVAEGVREGKAAARTALELDSRNAHAHVALGKLAATYEFDWRTAEHHYMEALRLEPNSAVVLKHIQPFYYMMGRTRETLEASQRAVELDPLNTMAQANLAWTFWEQGRRIEGVDLLKESVSREPGNLPIRLSLIGTLVLDRRFDEARSFAETNYLRTFLPKLITAVENPEQHADAHQILGTPLFPGRRGWSWFSVPYYLAMGANDSVAAVLDRGVDEYDNGVMYYARHPDVIKAVGTHPRFQSYLRKLKLPEATP